MKLITENIYQLIRSLGGLHDATLLKLLWCAAEKRLEIEIDDLHANFSGLPEYKGPTDAIFIFSNVSRFNIEADLTGKGLMLYDWIFEKSDATNHMCQISFSPSGRMTIHCARIACKVGCKRPTSSE
jgi:hypothetical protein